MQGVKRQRQAEGALVEHGVHPRRRRREILARPPQGRVQRIEIAPQRGGDRREGRRLRRLAQGGWLVGERDQQLLQQGGTGEVRRPRVGYAARMGSGEGQQGLRAGGRLRRAINVSWALPHGDSAPSVATEKSSRTGFCRST